MRAHAKFLLALLSTALFSSLPAANAQVRQSVDGSVRHLWAGGELSDFQPDYNQNRVYGFGLYGDYYITRKIGIEGEARFLIFNEPYGLNEKSYMGGPIYNFYQRRKLSLYGKGLLGVGTVNFPFDIGYGSYFAAEAGGGAEYRIRRRWKVRGEYDYQFMPAAPGFTTPGFPNDGMNPNGFNVGLSYRIF